MPFPPPPSQSQIQASLRAVLLQILAENTEVIAAQDNRVPEPKSRDFVVMTMVRRTRLSTNVDASSDAKFVGSIAGTALTVTAADPGTVVPGRQLFGVDVVPGTKIVSGTAGGGTGAYIVDKPQVLSSRTLSAGATAIAQSTEVAMQLDVHGPTSTDNAQAISTVMRDYYGVKLFAELDPDYGVTPLHADDPKQIPFQNAEQQWETRWVVEVLLQADPVVSVPEEFADSVAVEVVSVDAVFPPS